MENSLPAGSCSDQKLSHQSPHRQEGAELGDASCGSQTVKEQTRNQQERALSGQAISSDLITHPTGIAAKVVYWSGELKTAGRFQPSSFVRFCN